MRSTAYRWSPAVENPPGLGDVLASGQLSHGPIAREMERYLARRHGVAKVVLTNSGTAALSTLLLRLRQSTSKRTIILPAFGYVAAANVAASLGFDLYIADSEEDSPVLCPRSVARLLDESVAAIVGINYFGWSVAWDQIDYPPSTKLVEDAAGSFGAEYRGIPSGGNADYGIMSFHVSKGVSSGGEGGALLIRDDEMSNDFTAVAKHGMRTGYYSSELIGSNMLMTDLSALFLRHSIDTYSRNFTLRFEAKLALDNICAEFGLSAHHVNNSASGRQQNHQAYVVMERNRDQLLEYLRLGGVEARPCWPRLLTEQSALAPFIKVVDHDAVRAQMFARNILNLPLHPQVEQEHLGTLRRVLQAWRS